MADKIKVKLLKPLNGAEVGTNAEYDEADVKRLESLGAVERVKSEPKHDNKAKKAAPKNKGKK